MSLDSFVKAGNLILDIVQDEKVQTLGKQTWQGLKRMGVMAAQPPILPQTTRPIRPTPIIPFRPTNHLLDGNRAKR